MLLKLYTLPARGEDNASISASILKGGFCSQRYSTGFPKSSEPGRLIKGVKILNLEFIFSLELSMFRVRILWGICWIAACGAFTAMPLSKLVNAASAQQGSKNIPPSVKSSKSSSNSSRNGKFLERGGYSVTQQDTINTYGDSRSLYGAAISFRDPQMDRQSNGGPFDHGFFFDSGIAPRGGEAPYLN